MEIKTFTFITNKGDWRPWVWVCSEWLPLQTKLLQSQGSHSVRGQTLREGLRPRGQASLSS